MSLAEPERPAAVWPIDPDPAATNLTDPQLWSFADGRPRSVETGEVRLAADDPRMPFLGIRRNAEGLAYPAAFDFCPETGAALPLSSTPSNGDGILELNSGAPQDLPLPEGVPSLFSAGRPDALYLFQENLGALEWRDAGTPGWIAMGRLPPADLPPHSHALATARAGFAYATRDALVAVPLPQLGLGLERAEIGLPELRFLAAPAWMADGLVAPASRAGRLVLCRLPMGGAVPAGPPALDDLGAAGSDSFSRPVANRLGDVTWAGMAGFVSCPSGPEGAALVPWPEGFAPVLAQPPYRDGRDVFHQLGTLEGRYHYASLSRTVALHRLDGPHLAAGRVSYGAAERFSIPWAEPVEALTLGVYGGSLLVPLLSLPRDTILMAVRIDGTLGDFIRGRPLRRPATGHVLHHAHGAGLRRLPVSLDVSAFGDAVALLRDGTLHLYSRTERRCQCLPVHLR